VLALVNSLQALAIASPNLAGEHSMVWGQVILTLGWLPRIGVINSTDSGEPSTRPRASTSVVIAVHSFRGRVCR
jgi:hypothetical protein